MMFRDNELYPSQWLTAIPLCVVLGAAWWGCVPSFSQEEAKQDVLTSALPKEKGGICDIVANPPCAYLQPGFDLDDPAARRMVGNLNTLGLAFRTAYQWAPTPGNADGFAATYEFGAVNLWDPYRDAPAVLRDGRPPDNAAGGTYWLWQDGNWWWAGGVTAGATLEVVLGSTAPNGHIPRIARQLQAQGILPEGQPVPEAPAFQDREGMEDALAFCRILRRVGEHADPEAWAFTYPGGSDGVGSPLDLEDLKAYWWLWDHQSFLHGAPGSLVDLMVSPRGGGAAPVCWTQDGTAWEGGRDEEERVDLADWASEVMEEKEIEH
ncbi:hypothetical protein H8D30_00330 [bacterium]|nr:hypothetical protein [bacterium]